MPGRVRADRCPEMNFDPSRAQAVPMGMAAVAGRGQQLAIYGLGSCIGLAVWHPRLARGVLCHVVLPEGRPEPGDPPARFAATAVAWALAQLPGPASTLVAKMAGGANLFPLAAGLPQLEIGRRNVEAVRAALAAAGVPLVAEHVGGRCGRTVLFSADDGRLGVRPVGGRLTWL